MAEAALPWRVEETCFNALPSLRQVLLIAALAAWGRDEGAVGACLQVEAGNASALALYDGFGLKTELYRYHYRRAPADTGAVACWKPG
jgi:ribosomal protein S18 acetylase RimI-like enzyme